MFLLGNEKKMIKLMSFNVTQNNSQNYVGLVKHNADTLVHALRSQFQSHAYHICKESPWPILTSGAVLAMLSSAALWFNSLEGSGLSLVLGLTSTTAAMALWWSDCVREGTYKGSTTLSDTRCDTIYCYRSLFFPKYFLGLNIKGLLK